MNSSERQSDGRAASSSYDSSARRAPASTARSRSPAARSMPPTTISRECFMPSGRRHHRKRQDQDDRYGARAANAGRARRLKRGDLGQISAYHAELRRLPDADEPRPPFDDDIVRYYGQYVALAVADTFEAGQSGRGRRRRVLRGRNAERRSAPGRRRRQRSPANAAMPRRLMPRRRSRSTPTT